MVTWTHSQLIAFVIAALSIPASAVDRSKFRSCTTTGFCRRYRAQNIIKNYRLDTSSINVSDGSLVARVVSPGDELKLTITPHTSGFIRVKVSEDEPRWQPTDLLTKQGLEKGPLNMLKPGDASLPVPVQSLQSDFFGVSLGHKEVLVVHADPIKFDLYKDDELLISANHRNLLHFEKTRKSGNGRMLAEESSTTVAAEEVDRHHGKEVVDYGEDGLAIYSDGTREERSVESDAARRLLAQEQAQGDQGGDNFGGHHDSQPRGPMSVGIDISFPFAQHVYGIPEHTSPLSLPSTTTGSAGLQPHYSQPYRLYNLDVFEYELDETMALYGHIPFMTAHALIGNQGVSAGVFWFNPSETFIDVADANGGGSRSHHKETHWISESGEVDLFLFPGPKPKDVFAKFTKLVGRQQLPPIFALGYHQCRWNYRDQKDVASVESKFEELDYPYDVLWLDIEHTNGKRYFTWDSSVFPNPVEMQRNISKHGRRMVTIVDPHIKRDQDYSVHREAAAKGLYVKDKHNQDFDGWCWPGSSSYLDFTSAKVRQWWASQFSLTNYLGSTMDLFTWNDMNEPSVFNGPEVSMSKDNLNLDGVEHREWHNLYGLYMQSATAEGLVQRAPKSSLTDGSQLPRPFVLSRAFWAGSQRYGAIWTGDNRADWGHLQIASPMLLSINLAGLSFAGADVGGFFGETSAELFTRWYQAGAFTPFFRGHAHHETKRKEPWVYGEPTTSIVRSVAMMRYSLLPYWYTTFHEAASLGYPVMRTMFTEFPDDPLTFALDDQWMVGSALLVKPVTEQGRTSISMYLPGPELWYDFLTLKAVDPSGEAPTAVSAPIDKIPVFIRSGQILPKKLRLRRSSKLMFYDPYTLTITPDSKGFATGSVYMDDETSFAHEVSGAFAHRELVYNGGELRCSKMKRTNDASVEIAVSSSGTPAPASTYHPANTVERIEIANQLTAPSSVQIAHKDATTPLAFVYDAERKVVTVKKPNVPLADDWVIKLM